MNSGVSITLPISMFGDVPIDQVIENIKDAETLKAQNLEQAQRIAGLKGQLSSAATDLTNIINADQDVMWKFEQLRYLSTAINGLVRDMGL